MSMKCACGSDDRLIYDGKQMVRIVDKKPHVCLGEQTVPNDNFDQEEIMLKSTQKNNSEITQYTKKENEILDEMESVLIEQDVTLKNNVQKLGMKLKIIYQSMPEELKSKVL